MTGIDLVREMFRIADGEELGYTDPVVRGHSIEFRVNAEDAGRGFLPAPGTITTMNAPSGPGVRLDAGYEAGMTVPQSFDSLVAKLIVTGQSRTEALERSRRALAELEIEGMPTVLPFHRAIVADPAFTSEPFTVHTRWIETEFDNTVEPYAGSDDTEASRAREKVLVEVGGRRLEVVLPAGFGSAAPAPASRTPRRGGGVTKRAAVGGDALVSSMQATVAMVARTDGDLVDTGDLVVVIEAMKMEQAVTAHKPGMITKLNVTAGQTIANGAVICEIVDM